ncbi:MAG: pyrroloquinoline quinone biosynthesis protein PqqB [Alphaproteobacteria bacterium]|mgnify:CR=1 FL=1|nr:pyrroloquinoline quinone biosynthesis protein PqqB [Alphaproteobacteria bacterium]
MLMIVLGAAAGGGFPQWNSNAPACRRARHGDPQAPARTQASLAVSADGKTFFLLNASPDLRQQIEATPSLHPADGPRHSPIAGVVLTGGDVDAIAGLLVLRERHAFTVWGAAPVMDVLEANPIFEVLGRDLVARRTVALDRPFPLARPDGTESGLTAELFAVPGKTPLYAERPGEDPPIIADGTTVGIAIGDGRSRAFFIPGCAEFPDWLGARLRGADLVFFDGTLWRDDEMITAGVGTKTGRRMGHMSQTGPAGTLAAFAGLGVRRKVLIHINNSNPVLLADSAERAEAEARGWTIAADGMRFET